ncbi:MAG: hypothetical protein IPK19_40715 [Chloroflexi bacterium]|nr:hypothetical protein [Chloroflexota bacterium]
MREEAESSACRRTLVLHSELSSATPDGHYIWVETTNTVVT